MVHIYTSGTLVFGKQRQENIEFEISWSYLVRTNHNPNKQSQKQMKKESIQDPLGKSSSLRLSVISSVPSLQLPHLTSL